MRPRRFLRTDEIIALHKQVLTLDPGDIVLFENKNKGDKRPDFYGWHHTGVKGREPPPGGGMGEGRH